MKTNPAGDKVATSDHKTILLVENDALGRADQGERLKNLGYEVGTVASCEEASLFIMDNASTSLVLIHAGLWQDRFTGSGLKQLLNSRDIPVVVLSDVAGSCSDENSLVFRHVGSMDDAVSFRGFLNMVFRLQEARKQEKQWHDLYASITQTAIDGFWMVDSRGNILEVNDALCLILGYRRSELLAMPISEFEAKEDREELARHRKKIISAGSDRFETRHRCKDGRIIDVEVSAHYLAERKVFLVFIRDITGRKQAEESIRILKHSIDKAPDPVYWMDKDGNFIYVNETGYEALGYGEDEMMGLHVSQVNPKATKERWSQVWEAVKEKGTIAIESIHRKKDGTEFPVELTSTYYKLGDIEYCNGFARDVTERKRLEEQLRQAQKMEAIGTLAGGVAHDFNNLLTVIKGFANLIQMVTDKDDQIRPYSDEIVEASNRAADLTQSLLAFSRKQRIDPEPHNVNKVVSNTIKLLGRLLPEDIELKVDLSKDDLISKVDITQINQVIMNLATNGRDAMPAGGILTIMTEAAVIDERFQRDHGFGKPGRYVCLSVADNGIGMGERTLGRIFDPFFTTKEVGKGTGLGLASVYGIIKQHDGYITVTSKLAHGSRFDMYLPMIEAHERPPEAVHPDISEGRESILIIEDDQAVRNMMALMLQRGGYSTHLASEGESAILLFEEMKSVIDLVILDVVMPKMNGKEVFERIQRIDPSVKAIFVSGYTGDVVIDKGVEQEKVDFLQKPLSAERLYAKVREVLDRPDR
jgi:two-component system, cell cycle sensor histidine kinase and response regulator CckA